MALALKSFQVLGVRVHSIQIPEVIATLEGWIEEGSRCHTVAVTGMHGVTVAQDDPPFKTTLNNCDLVVPDGMPLVWLGRRMGHALERRVYGPELMETFCDQTGKRFRHFLYGGGPGVAETLAHTLSSRYGTRVVGTACPPFRELTSEEKSAYIHQINESSADIVWVGLSTPKQETWMEQFAPSLQSSVALGCGAAFDLVSGLKHRAPSFMKEHGWEWLFRLATEPRRLWRRYLIGGPRFVWYLAAERLRLGQR